MKWKNHINHVVNMANIMLGLLKEPSKAEILHSGKNLYVALIIPHLVYAVQTWNPHLIGDIEILELVQRQTLKIDRSSMVSGVTH